MSLCLAHIQGEREGSVGEVGGEWTFMVSQPSCHQ